MQVELVFFYELIWAFEFAAEEVSEQTRVGHNLVVFDVGVDQKFTKEFLDFVVEVLLIDLLGFVDRNAAFVGLL